jgi:hypothetical protein
MRIGVRKLAAILALSALLLPGVSVLAESLSSADLPACCTTAYCPVHHRQARDLQRDRRNCDSMGVPGQQSCSLRACDSAPSPAVGTVVYLLATPTDNRSPWIAEAAPVVASKFFPVVTAVPPIPPPRASHS